MGFLCNQHKYPIRFWIKMSAMFSLCLVSILIVEYFFSDQEKFLAKLGIAFFGFFSIIVSNLLLFVHYDVQDPVKSPLKVKALSFLVTYCICLILYVLSNYLGLFSPAEYKVVLKSPGNFFLIGAFHAAILNVVVQLWLYFVMNDHFKKVHELERSKLDKMKERAENQMLRQQIQPHFLFNALSSLKALIKKDSNLAESYLLQLSGYLRGSFHQSEDGLSTVGQEIKLCEDYLSMQKVRFRDAIQYEVNVPEELLESQLPIFSLQPLIDNALKHNFYTNDKPLSIEISERKGWIVVKNNFSPRTHETDDVNHYGLNSLKERFSYYLKDSIVIQPAPDHFEVHVKIISI